MLCYLPLEKCVAFHLNKLESPSPKDALCQVWLKLVHLEKKILKFINVISLFCYLPLEKGVPLYLNKLETWILFTKECMCIVYYNWFCGSWQTDF